MDVGKTALETYRSRATNTENTTTVVPIIGRCRLAYLSYSLPEEWFALFQAEPSRAEPNRATAVARIVLPNPIDHAPIARDRSDLSRLTAIPYKRDFTLTCATSLVSGTRRAAASRGVAHVLRIL